LIRVRAPSSSWPPGSSPGSKRQAVAVAPAPWQLAQPPARSCACPLAARPASRPLLLALRRVGAPREDPRLPPGPRDGHIGDVQADGSGRCQSGGGGY
jgi:hypothetical protein